jgi:hypothetical protein
MEEGEGEGEREEGEEREGERGRELEGERGLMETYRFPTFRLGTYTHLDFTRTHLKTGQERVGGGGMFV